MWENCHTLVSLRTARHSGIKENKSLFFTVKNLLPTILFFNREKERGTHGKKVCKNTPTPICEEKVKTRVENPGIDPGTSRMLSERSTI